MTIRRFSRSTFGNCRNGVADEKRRFEARIHQLEEELEEEKTNSELYDEKIKKLAMNYEQALLDIATERANSEKLEVNISLSEYRHSLLSSLGCSNQSRTTNQRFT